MKIKVQELILGLALLLLTPLAAHRVLANASSK
jgi:hypothetical protein